MLLALCMCVHYVYIHVCENHYYGLVYLVTGVQVSGDVYVCCIFLEIIMGLSLCSFCSCVSFVVERECRMLCNEMGA